MSRKFKSFFRPILGDLQKKKKKRSSPKFRAIFLPISQVQTFEGGLFLYGGGYFPFFTQNRPQKLKKHAILHTSQTNGGARAPPPPPGYATGTSTLRRLRCVYLKGLRSKQWCRSLLNIGGGIICNFILILPYFQHWGG